MKDFSDKVRNGEWLGATGKPLTNIVAVGIGGSFLAGHARYCLPRHRHAFSTLIS